jgi:hypothetical protein
MDVSRRTLARALIASAAIPVAAQTPTGADEETLSAHEALRMNAEQLAKVEIPIATEPAVHFKA